MRILFHYFINHEAKNRALNFLGDIDYQTQGIGSYTFRPIEKPLKIYKRMGPRMSDASATVRLKDFETKYEKKSTIGKSQSLPSLLSKNNTFEENWSTHFSIDSNSSCYDPSQETVNSNLPVDYLDRIKNVLNDYYQLKGYKLNISVYNIFPAEFLIPGDEYDIQFEYVESDINIDLE